MRASSEYRTWSKDAFTAVPTGGIYLDGTGCGNSGLGILGGPSQFNWGVILIKETLITDTILSPTISFRGDSDLPGAGINMGFRYYVKPFKMEPPSHHHDADEYLFFLGAQPPDLTANFDAEIEIFLGPEYERHIITRPCILYIPRGFEHNPMNIKRVGKPLLFMPLLLAPYFNGVYQTGYMQFIGNEKID